MGGMLEKPMTEKKTQLFADRSPDLLAACSEMQGWRIDMEVSVPCRALV